MPEGGTLESRLGRKPVLDGLRGAAISLVLLEHAARGVPIAPGPVGVGIFFALSGFLITKLLLEEYDVHKSISLKGFYFRRALRLLPALSVMLLCYAVFSTIFSDDEQLRRALLSSVFAFFYLTPVALALGFDVPLSVASTWSLSAEEYFYLVWPMLMLLILRLKVGRRLPAIICFMIMLAMLLRGGTFLIFGYRIYTAPTTWIDGLMMGCLTAILWHRGGLRSTIFPRLVPYAFLGLLLLSGWHGLRTSGISYSGVLSVVPIATCVIIIGCLSHGKGAIQALLNSPPMQWLGTRSYALYLWNSIFLLTSFAFLPNRAAQVAFGIAATAIIAEVSWRLVERPALRFKKFFAPRAATRVP